MFKTKTFCGNCFGTRKFFGVRWGSPTPLGSYNIAQTNKQKNKKVDLNFMYNLLNNVQVSPLPAKRGLF